MSKILFLTDTHIKGKNPEHRLGNYYQNIMDKIKEVITIAKDLGVDYVIHGGDLWDSELVSNVMVDEFVDLVEEAEIKWYILPGNHDEIGNNWELSKASSLAHIFRRSKLINELTILETDKSFIQGFPYYHNCEQTIREKGLIYQKNTNKTKIAIVHALVTLKPLPYECMHVVAKDIKTNFDIVLVAHNHSQYGIKTINGTKFIWLGCMGRRKIDEKNIKPSLLYINEELEDINIIPLKSAKPANEVFDLVKIEEAKKFSGEIDNFITSLTEVKFEGLDILSIIEKVAKDKKVEKDIVEETTNRIGRFK